MEGSARRLNRILWYCGCPLLVFAELRHWRNRGGELLAVAETRVGYARLAS